MDPEQEVRLRASRRRRHRARTQREEPNAAEGRAAAVARRPARATATAAAANVNAGGAGAMAPWRGSASGRSRGCTAAADARAARALPSARRGRQAGCVRRPALALAASLLSPWVAVAQTQYFEILPYRDPTQCERMQCLARRLDHCRDHLEGFYLREKGCNGRQICTECTYGDGDTPTICKCENPPYSVEVRYGEECNAGKVCAPGEGICFRPCDTFLHVTTCPEDYCKWDRLTYKCVKRPATVKRIPWRMADYQDTIYKQAETIVQDTPVEIFPLDFADFQFLADGYRIRDRLLENLTHLETVFLQLDGDNNGMLNKSEYSGLPVVFRNIDTAVANQLAKSRRLEEELDAESAKDAAEMQADVHRRLQANPSADVDSEVRRLQSTNNGNLAVPQIYKPPEIITPETCGALRPRRYYCSFDVACKVSCKECGWKSATDEVFSTCVRPTPAVCAADGGQLYCESDKSCHPPSNCENCVDRPIVDHSLSQCLALWWKPEPLEYWTNWVCRHRNKNGMPCRNDQDCIYGLRRCLNQKCMPKQPYNANHTCESDFDCPHMGYYCPKDPTGGENPYWIQYCRKQRSVGMTCTEDRECAPDLRCNSGEPQPRCRRLFSLEAGSPSNHDELCTLGWRDRNNKCAPPARSKEAGRPCDSDRDCTTTDMTGRTGRCVCKDWWEKDEAKYCEPVVGDYKKHQENLRDFLSFIATKCGSFWTEKECFSVYGNQVRVLKLRHECERQRLSGGPFLPPSDCGIDDYDRFGDKCAKLAELER
eukprot:TRINITY_DN54732_c0_g1_i1.p1 TRINITY_DN54732_c0_g1~~TRINITY_DN54732_c0_g1_i1.p1  ORF type:complete len:800 (-),score=141.63 TRINITY_DN54732_c0_g1_i1:105-2411(-)